MLKLPDPSLIPDKTPAKLIGMLWGKMSEVVDAVNRLQPTGPTPQDRKIEQLERAVRLQNQAILELERQVRMVKR